MKPNTKLIVISVLISVVSSVLLTNILLGVKGSPLFSDASSRFGLPKPRPSSVPGERELISPNLFRSLVNNGAVDNTINGGIIATVDVYINGITMTMRNNVGSELMFNFDTLIPVVMAYDNQSLTDEPKQACDIYKDWSEVLMNLYAISNLNPFKIAADNASTGFKECMSMVK